MANVLQQCPPLCKKRLPGSRVGIKRRKKNKSNPLAHQATSLVHPASVVNTTLSGAQQSNFSSMTANTEVQDDDDASTSTTTSIDTTDTVVKELLRKDVRQIRAGGNSDEDGESYFALTDIHDATRDCLLDKRLKDCSEIESIVHDDNDNRVECTISTTQTTLEGAPKKWIEPGCRMTG